MIKSLSLDDIKHVTHKIAQEMMTWSEPIPDFDTRYPNILESCLATPFQTFDKKMLYTGLLNKAAILFYLLIKDHPFENGNKRIAVISLLAFLHSNNKWIEVSNQELYNFAVWVASSPAQLKDSVVDGIRHFLQKNLVDA